MKDIRKVLDGHKVLNLDVGGGLNPQRGFLTLDWRDNPSVDVKVKGYLDIPYPLPDESVDFIRCANVVEKISRENFGFVRWMDEMWRILKFDHQMALATVYATSYLYYQDPTNVNPCNEGTWAFFDPLERQTKGIPYTVYRPKPWRIVTMTFDMTGIMEVLLEKRREDKSYNG